MKTTHVFQCFTPLETWSQQVGVFAEMPGNRFHLNFTLALWTKSMRVAHSLELLQSSLQFILVVFKDYPRLHTLFSTLWPGSTDHVPFYTTGSNKKGHGSLHFMLTHLIPFSTLQSSTLPHTPTVSPAPCIFSMV